MSFAVVIPAYNEAATIADIIQRVLAQPCETVIVVDDGSTDSTARQVNEYPVTLLNHPHNQGKSASLGTGIRHALSLGADAVITLDGDAQHRPEDLPRLLQAGAANPNNIIIAARLRGREQVPKARRFANAQADFWISWAAGYRIDDSQSGFRLYPAALLRQVEHKLQYDKRRGFVFESEILIDAARLNYYARNVIIDAIYSQQARASHYRPALDTTRIVEMVAWKLISRGLYLPGLVRSLRRGKG